MPKMISEFPAPALSDRQKLFHAMAVRSAFDYFRAMPPMAPAAIGEYDPFGYLPRSEAQAQTFQPHGWVYTAMEKAFNNGVEQGKNESSDAMTQLEVNCQQRIDALKAVITEHERTIKKFELVDAIRLEVNSFSVNTKDLMDLVDDLARLVR